MGIKPHTCAHCSRLPIAVFATSARQCIQRNPSSKLMPKPTCHQILQSTATSKMAMHARMRIGQEHRSRDSKADRLVEASPGQARSSQEGRQQANTSSCSWITPALKGTRGGKQNRGRLAAKQNAQARQPGWKQNARAVPKQMGVVSLSC